MRTREVKINIKKLLDYGFILKDDYYYYEKNILNNKFKVVITFKDKLYSKVIDNKLNEEYFRVDESDATGNYVGEIRTLYEDIINDIVNSTSINEKYHYKQMRDVIKYIKNTYGDSPEYLWKNDFKTGAIRNKNNKKWYTLIMVINSSKLGLKEDKEIEVINIRYQKDKTEEVIDNKNIFPAWHMTKRSWITILLDGTLDNEIVYSLIDNSYSLSAK